MRVAVITGGMGGLGESISTKMHAAGYRVVVTHSPSNTKAEEWLSAHKADGREFSAYPVDVADFASSSLRPFLTLDSSKLAPPSVSFCNATLLATTTSDEAAFVTGANIAMKKSSWTGSRTLSKVLAIQLNNNGNQNYATLVSGVLIGLSEALEQGKKTKL